MSDVCFHYTRQIETPVPISLQVEMTEGGLIDHIAGAMDDDIAPFDEVRVTRAVIFTSQVMQAAQNEGQLLADVLAHLPDHPTFEVERSIFAALADLQGQVLNRHIAQRGAA